MTRGDRVLRVEGLGKKFCRSLKRSMLYGVMDLARGTLHPGLVQLVPPGRDAADTVAQAALDAFREGPLLADGGGVEGQIGDGERSHAATPRA